MSTPDYMIDAERDSPAGDRPKNAAKTRDLIMKAAGVAFTQYGYAGASVRDIAGAAGVNSSLINRYFGSKKGLFTAVIPPAFEIAPLLEGDRRVFGRELAAYVLSKTKTPDTLDATLALLRSASDPSAAEIMRAALEERFLEPLATWLGGRDAQLRAAMILSTLSGMAMMRDVMKITALAGSSPGLEERLAATLQSYVDDE